VIEGETVEIAPTGGAAEHAVAIPAVLARTRGPIIARALLSDAEGNALGMAATPLAETQPRIEVTGISAPEVARPGEQIAVQVRYRADAPASLAVELIDAFGRVVSREEIAGAAGDEAEANVSLMVRDPLSVYHRVAVTALDGEAVADRRERDVFVPEASADHLDRFMLGVGYAVMQIRCPEYLQDHLVAFMRAHGVETATVNEYMVRRGMPSFGGTLRAPMAHRSGGNERDPSFSDPEKVAALAEHTVNAVAEKHRWGFYGFNMTDEVHLHQRATVETDTGEHALRNWRAWSEELYGTIEAANASWGTDYASFDAANIPLIADMRGETNPARWVDFRVFMEREWAGAYAAAYRAVKEQYPDVNMSFTNPYKYNSLSGTDFSLWIPNEDVLLRYIPRHSLDRNTSWSDAPILSWFGYRSNHRAVGHTVWNFALAGGVVPFWWNPIEPWAYAGEEGFRPWNMFGPLWRETGRSQAVTRSTEQLQSGIGRLLRAARQEQPEAAILHSQPSMHVLYWEVAVEHGGPTDAGWNRYIASDDAMAAALKRQGMGYTYLLPDQLNAETLAGIRLLALPSCVALSDDAAAALAEYVRSGGRILADTLPATHDEHGSPREAGSPLAPLFGATGARMLGDYADGDSTEALDSAIADLEVQASRTWRKADGGLPEYTRAYRYQLGDGHYLGIVRDPTDRAYADGEVTVELGGDYFVYDSVARRSLGRMSSLTFNLRAGAARFFSLLPYQPRQVRLTAQFEGDDLVIEAGVDAEAMTDHLLHVTVVPPGAEQPAQHYTRTILAEGGRVQTRIPMALNDPAGLWMVGVRDVATGLGDARAVGRR
ncbi:MAG: beta-galactosidase, partial [Armatimonadota bacterium]